MSRKTVEVEQVKEWVNLRLASPSSMLHHLDDLTPEQAFREGQMSLMEQILHVTGNYRGFNYLPSEFDRGGLKSDYDETRRYYL